MWIKSNENFDSSASLDSAMATNYFKYFTVKEGVDSFTNALCSALVPSICSLKMSKSFRFNKFGRERTCTFNNMYDVQCTVFEYIYVCLSFRFHQGLKNA